jgi:hypothetical protein
MDRDKILHAAADAVAAAWLSSQDTTSEQSWLQQSICYELALWLTPAGRLVIFVLARAALTGMSASPQPDTMTDKTKVTEQLFKPRSEANAVSEYKRE